MIIMLSSFYLIIIIFIRSVSFKTFFAQCKVALGSNKTYHSHVVALDFRLLPYQAVDGDSEPVPSYKTNPFTAHSLSWGVHAYISDASQENVRGTASRALEYKLVLQTRPRVPMLFFYVILKGPYGAINLNPIMNEFQFRENAMETPHHDIPCCDQFEGNAFVASRSIKLRLALIQVKKWFLLWLGVLLCYFSLTFLVPTESSLAVLRFRKSSCGLVRMYGVVTFRSCSGVSSIQKYCFRFPFLSVRWVFNFSFVF